MLADGSESGKADPFFDAHMLPIGEWALACWEGWVSDMAIDVVTKAAEQMVKTAKKTMGESVWAWCCYGHDLPQAGVGSLKILMDL